MSTAAIPRTIIGIPGRWESRSDIVTAIAKSSGGYLFAGMVLMEIATKSHFTLEIDERNEALAEAFSVAGRGRLSEDDIQAIGEHTFCLYLIGDGGATESAQKLMKAASALLDCGGLAVKVESAGTAHSAAGWRELCVAGDFASMLTAFVTYVGGPGSFYSCGMHNLGCPDCVVEARIDPKEAAILIHTFLGFLLTEAPTINSGETFSVDAESPRYRLFKEECKNFGADDPFHNPFGIWRFVPA